MTATDPEFVPEDYEGLNPAQTTISNAELRKLRKDRQLRQELEARVAEMERREVFSRAGIPLDDPAARYFVKAYDGALDPEAIKTAAIEARILAPTNATADEIQGHQVAQNAAAGGVPTTVAPDYQAQLAELAKQRFAPSDEGAMQDHIRTIAQLAKAAGANIPIS